MSAAAQVVIAAPDGAAAHPSAARPRPAWAGLLFVLVLSIVSSMVWLSEPPLEMHEILVVQTANEMHTRGDWIVPQFDDAPRLNKPPLNYWLTSITAHALGHEFFGALDGRLPSAIAAVALVMTTAGLGTLLFGRGIGLGAGAMLSTFFGVSEYAHSARPEMVYAAASFGALTCLIAAWRGVMPRAMPWAAWTLIGLATLAKGPHVPAMMLAGLAIALALHPTGRTRMLAILMPVRGIALAAAISVWWWIAVERAVGAEAMSQSQLLGSRFMLGARALLDPAYLYTIWPLLLPWVVLWPGLVVMLVRPGRFGVAARALTIVLAAGIMILSVGDEKRDHYLLPYLPLAAVLMSAAARRLAAGPVACASMKSLRIWQWAVIIVLCGAALVIAAATAGEPRPALFMPTILISATTVMVLAALWSTRAGLAGLRCATGLLPLVSRSAIAAMPLLLAMIGGHVFSGRSLDERARAGSMIIDLPADQVIGAVGVEAAYFVYYGRHFVHEYPTLDEMAKAQVRPDWVIMTDTLLREARARGIDAAEVDRVADCRSNVDWILVRWNEPPA